MRSWPEQRLREVADGITVILNGQGEVGVANAVFVIEGDRALVIDTMTFPEMAEGMAREITRRHAHVDIVLNTHHHIDHIGGNKLFAGARVFAHPASIRSLERLGFPIAVYDTLMPQFRGQFADLELVVPEPTLNQFTPPRGGELRIFTPAHTAADVAVWFPESRVLIAGDIGFIGVTPLAVHGLISAWIDALDALVALKPEVVVPGHGPLGSAQDLIVLRAYLSAVLDLGRHAVEEGVSIQDVLADFDAGPVAEWIEPERTSLNLERAMQEAHGGISPTDVSALLPSLRSRNTLTAPHKVGTPDR